VSLEDKPKCLVPQFVTGVWRKTLDGNMAPRHWLYCLFFFFLFWSRPLLVPVVRFNEFLRDTPPPLAWKVWLAGLMA